MPFSSHLVDDQVVIVTADQMKSDQVTLSISFVHYQPRVPVHRFKQLFGPLIRRHLVTWSQFSAKFEPSIAISARISGCSKIKIKYHYMKLNFISMLWMHR